MSKLSEMTTAELVAWIRETWSESGVMQEIADRLERLENEAWDAGFNAAITEGGYRKASTVAVETIMDFETRMAVHFGTYTSEDEVKISDVFKTTNQIVLEMLEDGE